MVAPDSTDPPTSYSVNKYANKWWYAVTSSLLVLIFISGSQVLSD